MPFPIWRRNISASHVARRRFASDGWADNELAGSRSSFLSHMQQVVSNSLKGLEDLPATFKLDHLYLDLRMQRWQGRLASATNQIWPSVSPYLFRQPLELALSLTPRSKLWDRFHRRLLEHIATPLTKIPLDSGLPAGPLRFSNFLRFAPLLRRHVSSIGRRIGVHARHASSAPRSSSDPLNAIARDYFEPSHMLTAALYSDMGRDRLAHGQLSMHAIRRALTLEVAARLLRKPNPDDAERP